MTWQRRRQPRRYVHREPQSEYSSNHVKRQHFPTSLPAERRQRRQDLLLPSADVRLFGEQHAAVSEHRLNFGVARIQPKHLGSGTGTPPAR